jgi:predicted ATPase
VSIDPETFPTREQYPFSLSVFNTPRTIAFETPVTFFAGENGTGKSTLLEAMARKCGIHIWREAERSRATHNPHEADFHRHITVEWAGEPVHGSFFGAGIFNHFTRLLDEWAADDPGQLEYFGGSSLVTQSHGQSLMAYFRSRYRIRGLYFLDEPETALSPRSQIELLSILTAMGGAGHAQFVIASHSPLLLACPGAAIYGFDAENIRPVRYEDTEHYRIYRSFLEDRDEFLKNACTGSNIRPQRKNPSPS